MKPSEPSDRPVEQTVKIPALKFADEFKEPILAGRKTATLRLFIDYDDFRTGRRFHLCDQDGERFASAIVSDRGYERIEWLAEHGIDGHQDYASVDELVEAMQGYYADADVTPETCVEIIYWDWEDLWQ